MPTITVNTGFQNFTTANEDWIIAPGVTLGGFFATGAAAGTRVTNYGNVFIGEGHGANIGVGNFILFNRPDAKIVGDTAVNITGVASLVENDGELFGMRGDGLVFGADNCRLVNTGTIRGMQHGLSAQGSADDVIIDNSGTIRGELAGIIVSSGSAEFVNITNTGTIRGGTHGIQLINAAGGQPFIDNSGTIIGDVSASAGCRLNLKNTGTIVGTVAGSSLNQVDFVQNDGKVTGVVYLGDAGDTYIGSGSVEGFVSGENGADSITGGAFADEFYGGSESDTLNGAAGLDQLTGDSGADFFVFNSPLVAANRDRITDFVRVDDTIRLENAIFKGIGGNGTLAASIFKLSTQAKDPNDRIIYNKANGQVSYDADGSGAKSAIVFATLDTKPTINNADFVVI